MCLCVFFACVVVLLQDCQYLVWADEDLDVDSPRDGDDSATV